VTSVNFSGYGSVNGTTATAITVDTKRTVADTVARDEEEGRVSAALFLQIRRSI